MSDKNPNLNTNPNLNNKAPDKNKDDEAAATATATSTSSENLSQSEPAIFPEPERVKYTFTDTECELGIHIELIDAMKRECAIFMRTRFLTVRGRGMLDLTIYFSGEIDAEQSIYEMENTMVKFQLKKKAKGKWPSNNIMPINWDPYSPLSSALAVERSKWEDVFQYGCYPKEDHIKGTLRDMYLNFPEFRETLLEGLCLK